MWEQIEHRMALLELVVTGSLRCRKSQQMVWDHLAELSWTKRTDRRDELAIVGSQRTELEALLDRIWPDWQEISTALADAGLPANIKGWRQLQDLKKARATKQLPSRLNRRTATALVGPHSKAGLTPLRLEALSELSITHDGILRLRIPNGLRLCAGNKELECDVIVEILGEVIITERALADGTKFTGQLPRAILLVENLGAYQDISAPPNWLIVHVPGWDTRTVKILLQHMNGIPVAHFGDLDPNGIRIMRHLRAIRPDLHWIVPDFWKEYIPTSGIPVTWPQEMTTTDLPHLVRELISLGLWLEQEAIVLDPRLTQIFADFSNGT